MNYWNLIPWGISLASLIVVIVNLTHSNKKDLQAEESRFSRLNEGLLKANLKLDTVCATTNETRSDIKAMNEKLTEHSEKIAVLARDLETAFMRIDELRNNKADRSEVKHEQK